MADDRDGRIAELEEQLRQAGWIVAPDGGWITDPNRTGDGAMLAFGSHKGSGSRCWCTS